MNQRTPSWGGGKKEGGGKFQEGHPLQKGVLDPPRTVRFPPPSGVSVLCSSCTKIHLKISSEIVFFNHWALRVAQTATERNEPGPPCISQVNPCPYYCTLMLPDPLALVNPLPCTLIRNPSPRESFLGYFFPCRLFLICKVIFRNPSENTLKRSVKLRFLVYSHLARLFCLAREKVKNNPKRFLRQSKLQENWLFSCTSLLFLQKNPSVASGSVLSPKLR